MKLAIVVAGLIIAAAAALLAIRPDILKPASLAHVQKSDIFGFSPGMTAEETGRLITQRRYLCRENRETFTLECAVNGAKVTVDTDAVDPRHPVWRVNAELSNAGPDDAAVKSISDQFNAQPAKDAQGWQWIVGRALKLTYDGNALKLVDEAAEKRLREEDAKRSKGAAPKS
ncbi:hypothetical protein C2U70_17365 [Bradyrhizobium guangdongense]|uniref:hypothetical protein n=1 Tax=Bradyrhizobium guangdongense TaxID=1325090 RepID=UPI001128BDF8|nr:hypothetical protein [Bradyrhizobium guangdongense]TPQ34275.1 hypothetical protein C2U70_17365 [Bradyrhizobium guangdongense]